MNMLNTLDYIILVIAIIGGIWGAIKGFIDEMSQKFGYVAGFAAGIIFTLSFSQIIKDILGCPQWVSALIAYFVLFMLGYSLIKGYGHILNVIFDKASLNWVNSMLGFVIGLAEVAVILGIVETVLLSQNTVSLENFINSSWISANVLVPFFSKIISAVYGLL